LEKWSVSCEHGNWFSEDFRKEYPMPNDDSQVLAAVDYTAQQDRRIRDDIKKAIDSHDRDFFEQVVLNVLARLHRTVKDVTRFMDSAYEWFRSRL